MEADITILVLCLKEFKRDMYRLCVHIYFYFFVLLWAFFELKCCCAGIELKYSTDLHYCTNEVKWKEN